MKIGIRGLPRRCPSRGRTPREVPRAGPADAPQVAPPPFPDQPGHASAPGSPSRPRPLPRSDDASNASRLPARGARPSLAQAMDGPNLFSVSATAVEKARDRADRGRAAPCGTALPLIRDDVSTDTCNCSQTSAPVLLSSYDLVNFRAKTLRQYEILWFCPLMNPRSGITA